MIQWVCFKWILLDGVTIVEYYEWLRIAHSRMLCWGCYCFNSPQRNNPAQKLKNEILSFTNLKMNSFKKIDERLLNYSCNFAARLQKGHAQVQMECDQGQSYRGDALHCA